MKPGIYTVYAVQQRVTHKSPWQKPKEKLEHVERGDWAYCGRDYWGRSTNPRVGTGNDWRPRNKAMSDDGAAILRSTGLFGWTKIEYAEAALKNLRKDDAAGMYDSRDSYEHHDQAVRHEFRMVRVEMTYNCTMTVINEGDSTVE